MRDINNFFTRHITDVFNLQLTNMVMYCLILQLMISDFLINVRSTLLSGVLPLDLRAERDRDYTALVRWDRSIDGTGLDPESIELWRPSYRREYLGRISSTWNLRPRTSCSYYTDGSKQQKSTVGCAFTVETDSQIVIEGQFRLTDGAEVCTMHWIKAHVVHVYNERADELAKAAMNRPTIGVEVKTTRHQALRHLFGRALSRWLNRWDTTANGEVTYELFLRVRIQRLHGDFYLN